MLARLFISNYAIISELEISFTRGLNIITGETGAGKSILMGALGLILGERADSSVLLDKSRKCMVEGVFAHDNRASIREFLDEHELENDGEIILRREIGVNGKSRAFVNDSPVNLSQLQQLASMLVDLHQQFDTLELGQNRFQLEILDVLAGQLPIRRNYSQLYQEWLHEKQRLAQLENAREESLREHDYYQFLHQELEDSAFSEGELERLEAEQNLLVHAEQVDLTLRRLISALDEDEQPITQQLKSLIQALEGVARYHAPIQALAERLRSTQIELKDIADEAGHLASGIHSDAARQQEVNERLSLGYRLLKKHSARNTAGLLAVHEQIRTKLDGLINLDQEILSARKAYEALLAKATQLASQLSAGRAAAVDGFEKKVRDLLHRVGMPNAVLKVQLEKGELSEAGSDRVEFLFDANKSGKAEPLRKVASGGEFSRLLLCIKTLVAGSVSMPVMIFDEIDTGISGEAARQVGILMKEMGSAHQVISITHQPQIAAKADAHYFVYKQEMGGAIRTQLRRLTEEERIESIAKMMSGEKPSETALRTARELVTAN
jgi:DNA repair protein RecN (Recombination protein N)